MVGNPRMFVMWIVDRPFQNFVPDIQPFPPAYIRAILQRPLQIFSSRKMFKLIG